MAATALLLVAAAPAFSAADPARYMPAELIAASVTPKPGTTILVGFRMSPKPGWHGYWSNPGDSGIAPSVAWSAADGVRFGPLLHPAPALIRAGGISSFVHEGPHVLLARVTIGRSIAPGTPIPIEAKLDWAACTESQCVPLHATLELNLVAGDGATSDSAGLLRAAERALPAQARPGTFTTGAKSVALRLPAALKLDPRSARFFPDDNDAFDTASGRTSMDKEGLVIAGAYRTPPAESISGVATDGRRSYRLSFQRAVAPVPIKETEPAPVNAAVEPPPASRSAGAPAAAAAPARSKRFPWSPLGGAVVIAAAAALLWRRSGRP